jgi:HK97 gp10 family phage protein
MVGKVSFELKGAKEMEALLKDLGPRVATRLGDKALRAAARPIVKEAKRLVPKKTGALRKAITAVASSRGRAANERLVLIGFKPPVSRRAHFIEYGTSRQPAQPFIRPALDTMADDALKAMAESLASSILRQEWKGALKLIADGEDLFAGEE